ncbi:hypothetical protein [Streptomyces sp. NPDC093094]|uniref:hypothetical protein n=1 Tax=Streptomyces sp. NPDC093094 TaxID=3366026 RepID=UPI003811B826
MDTVQGSLLSFAMCHGTSASSAGQNISSADQNVPLSGTGREGTAVSVRAAVHGAGPGGGSCG